MTGIEVKMAHRIGGPFFYSEIISEFYLLMLLLILHYYFNIKFRVLLLNLGFRLISNSYWFSLLHRLLHELRK